MCPGVLQPAHYLKSCPNIRILNLASRWSWSTNKCSQYMLKLSPVVLNASVLLVPFRNTGVSFQCFLAGHAFKGPGCTFYFSMARKPPQWARDSSLSRLHDHTQETPHSVGLLWTGERHDAKTCTWLHTTLTKKQISMPPAGFEPTSQWPQTHALDRAATGIGSLYITQRISHTKHVLREFSGGKTGCLRM